MSVTADEWPKLRPQCFCLRARCSSVGAKATARSAEDHHHRDDSAAIDRGADRVPVLYAIQP
jgi:hypothetical protein